MEEVWRVRGEGELDSWLQCFSKQPSKLGSSMTPALALAPFDVEVVMLITQRTLSVSQISQLNAGVTDSGYDLRVICLLLLTNKLTRRFIVP